MNRNDPSVSQILVDEFRGLRSDFSISMNALRADLAAISKRTEEAHQRLDRYQNRIIGWATGVGGLGLAGGAAYGNAIKSLLKALIS